MRIGRAGILSVLVGAFLIGASAGALAASVRTQPSTLAHPGTSETLTVSVGTTFSFSLSSNEITPGDQVTVTIVDLGDEAHTFTLSPIPNFQFNSSDSTAHLVAFFAAHKPLVNLSVNGTVGEQHSETFTAPAYGLYEYVCLESGHFSAGMWGLLGSGEAGSGGSTATGPGWQVFAIGGGIASLVVITIVLAFVIGARPGSRHEMPPERLGYPETPPEASGAPPASPPPH